MRKNQAIGTGLKATSHTSSRSTCTSHHAKCNIYDTARFWMNHYQEHIPDIYTWLLQKNCQYSTRCDRKLCNKPLVWNLCWLDNLFCSSMCPTDCSLLFLVSKMMACMQWLWMNALTLVCQNGDSEEKIIMHEQNFLIYENEWRG